jgi:hypothetical protein
MSGAIKLPSRIVWEVCGSPAVEDCADVPEQPCWVCGGATTRGVERERWMGRGFVGQNRVRAPWSNVVCEPCLFVMSRTSPVPGRPPAPGKKLGGNFRNYSHLWEGGEPAYYANASKGEKPAILEFLRRAHEGPWFAAIADSGQKHVIPWTGMNRPGRGGRVMFDETIVQLPRDDAGWRLVDDLAALLTAGATKEEISRGEYGPFTWQRCPSEIRAFEAAHGHGRGGAWFGLALWLAQRDEAAVQARLADEAAARKAAKVAEKSKLSKRSKSHTKSRRSHGEADRGKERRPARADGDAAAGDPARVPADTGVLAAEALGPVADADARGGADVRVGGGMGDGDGAKPATPRARQLSLFGAA